MMNAIPIHAKIVNASHQDATFLQDVVALFTDPKNAEMLESVRSGAFAIVYSPKTGQAHYLPVENGNAPALPAEMINFIARFDHAQWKQLATTTNIRELLEQDIAIAEARATAVLGFLPGAQELEVANG